MFHNRDFYPPEPRDDSSNDLVDCYYSWKLVSCINKGEHSQHSLTASRPRSISEWGSRPRHTYDRPSRMSDICEDAVVGTSYPPFAMILLRQQIFHHVSVMTRHSGSSSRHQNMIFWDVFEVPNMPVLETGTKRLGTNFYLVSFTFSRVTMQT